MIGGRDWLVIIMLVLLLLNAIGVAVIAVDVVFFHWEEAFAVGASL